MTLNNISQIQEYVKTTRLEDLPQLVECITNSIKKLRALSLDSKESANNIKAWLKQNPSLVDLIENVSVEEIEKTISITINKESGVFQKVQHHDGTIEEKGGMAIAYEDYLKEAREPTYIGGTLSLRNIISKTGNLISNISKKLHKKTTFDTLDILEPTHKLEDKVDEDNWIGQTIFGYTLEKILGRGGMGIVYEGKDERTGRKVAVKRILSKKELPMIDEKEYNDFIQRFNRERKIIVPLSKKNENIVKIEFSAERSGIPFYIMEYLGATIPNKARSLEEAIGIIIQANAALYAVHNVEFSYKDQNDRETKVKGIAHRDIKPGNILLKDDATVKLTDFGLAKPTQRTDITEITQLGTVMGTPKYMSPEQITGKEVNTKTDNFSLGIVFYELLTGKSPWELDERSISSIQNLHFKLLDYPPELLEQARPSFIKQKEYDRIEIPPKVDELVYAMLQPDETKRLDSTEILNRLIEFYKRRWETEQIYEPTLNRAFEIVEKEGLIA